MILMVKYHFTGFSDYDVDIQGIYSESSAMYQCRLWVCPLWSVFLKNVLSPLDMQRIVCNTTRTHVSLSGLKGKTDCKLPVYFFPPLWCLPYQNKLSCYKYTCIVVYVGGKGRFSQWYHCLNAKMGFFLSVAGNLSGNCKENWSKSAGLALVISKNHWWQLLAN